MTTERGEPLAAGYARARELTRHHSKSFYFSSLVLFGQRRRSAFALYALCRRLDDVVDGEGRFDDASAPAPRETALRVSEARQTIAALFDAEATAATPRSEVWPAEELAAFRDTVDRFQIPKDPFLELINGMEMDLTKTRYATYEELWLYCYRVAGVVGLMMTHVLGFSESACLPFAVDLGVAMQLTNILRDVKEDWRRGRLYLPLAELAAFELVERDLDALVRGDAAHDVKMRWQLFCASQVSRARALYANALRGVPGLVGFGSRRVVRLMAAVYGDILDAIERQNFDVFQDRAHVPLGRKLNLAVQVFFSANPRHAPALAASRGIA